MPTIYSFLHKAYVFFLGFTFLMTLIPERTGLCYQAVSENSLNYPGRDMTWEPMMFTATGMKTRTQEKVTHSKLRSSKHRESCYSNRDCSSHQPTDDFLPTLPQRSGTKRRGSAGKVDVGEEAQEAPRSRAERQNSVTIASS